MVQTQENDLFGALGDTITEALKGFIDKITPKPRIYAPLLQMADTITVPASQSFAVMRIAGPTKGRFWYVRMLRVSGLTPTILTTAIQQFGQNITSNSTGITLTVPAGQTWSNIQGIFFQLTTDATVGNRSLVIVVRDPLNRTLGQYTFVTTQAASLTRTYQSVNGIATDSLVGTQVQFPDIAQGMTLGPGYSVQVSNNGTVGPGDNYTGLNVLGTGSTGRADIFVAPNDLRSIPTLAQIPITEWKDQIPSLPGVNVYSHGALRVASQESIYIALSGVTALQQYATSLEAYEYPDSDENVEWIM